MLFFLGRREKKTRIGWRSGTFQCSRLCQIIQTRIEKYNAFKIGLRTLKRSIPYYVNPSHTLYQNSPSKSNYLALKLIVPTTGPVGLDQTKTAQPSAYTQSTLHCVEYWTSCLNWIASKIKPSLKIISVDTFTYSHKCRRILGRSFTLEYQEGKFLYHPQRKLAYLHLK